MVMGIIIGLGIVVCVNIILGYHEDKELCYMDRSCYYCDFASPKYHKFRDNDVECPFYPLDRSSSEVYHCKYRKSSINFKEWLFS